MILDRAVLDELVVRPGSPADLDGRSTVATTVDWMGTIRTRHKEVAKEVAKEDLHAFVHELSASQELLWASGSYALLVVLQAMDAAGKDGTIKHVMSGVNPQGCRVVAFKRPSAEELGHDFLWRCSKVLPERGQIGIFNRSYYEDVLVVRVHPELLADAIGPSARASADVWSQRFDDINAFERHLHRSGTRIVKVFLHLSKEEQRRRLLERLDDPAKFWKYSSDDLAERRWWEDYQAAYEEALSATSTPWAPWYVVPADDKHALRALVGGIIVDAIERMELQLPKVDPHEAEALSRARAGLIAG
jgi:PPK2 family polyphosphate:nucleotide phosphotransferase